jgi:hypothetical protein
LLFPGRKQQVALPQQGTAGSPVLRDAWEHKGATTLDLPGTYRVARKHVTKWR